MGEDEDCSKTTSRCFSPLEEGRPARLESTDAPGLGNKARTNQVGMLVRRCWVKMRIVVTNLKCEEFPKTFRLPCTRAGKYHNTFMIIAHMVVCES